MDNKDREQIENILKKSAEDFEMKPFAERWKDIENRLEFDRNEKEVVKEQIPVLAMQNNSVGETNKKPIDNKLKITILSICLFLVIILAILIPVSFRNTEPVYFAPADLKQEVVTENIFFESINGSNIDLVNLDEYSCDGFTLLKSESGETQGGRFSINDEENVAIIDVTFYSSSVIVSYDDFTEAQKYNFDSTEILYKKLFEAGAELIEYKALAKHKNVIYELDYMSLTDNVLEFFNEFFS